jgi:uncharacterized protein Yka (UPF0111/DUF47 family)
MIVPNGQELIGVDRFFVERGQYTLQRRVLRKILCRETAILFLSAIYLLQIIVEMDEVSSAYY